MISGQKLVDRDVSTRLLCRCDLKNARPTIMSDIFTTTPVQLGLGITIIAVVIAVAFWLLRRLRDYTTQDHPEPGLNLSNLEEMLRKGDISEEEYRTIEASAHARLVSSDPAKSSVASTTGADRGKRDNQPSVTS